MKKTFLLLLMVVLTLFVAKSPATAGVAEEEWSISPFIGGHVYEGAQLMEPSVLAGLRLGYNPGRNWGVEGQFSYTRPRSEGIYGNRFSLEADLLYHFMPESDMVPYMLLGGGWTNTSRAPESGNGGIVDCGAGIKYFVNESVALRWDIRQIFSFQPGSGSDASYRQNAEFTVGLTFKFGGKKAASPAVKVVGEEPAPEREETLPFAWYAEDTTPPPGKIIVTGLKVEGNELEIIASDRIVDYKIVTLSEPSRLVIDIPNAVSGFRSSTLLIRKLGIHTVRFESYPEFLRIYLDAAQGRLIPYRIEETARGLKVVVTNP